MPRGILSFPQCSHCRKTITGAKYCPFDGVKLQPGDTPLSTPVNIQSLLLPFISKYCPFCDAKYHDGLNFCFLDGCTLKSGDNENKTEQGPLATIVCIECASASQHKSDCPRTESAQLLFKPELFDQVVALPYKPISVIARSELAVVGRATLQDGRQAIVKVFRTQLRDQQVVKRLERFLRLIPLHTKLQNAHIEQMFGYGQLPSTLPYCIFEPTVGNLSLTNLRGLFPIFPANYLITIFSEICEAISFMHERDMFHEQLTDDNVLLEPHTEDGVIVKLTDFLKAEPLILMGNFHKQFTERGDLFGDTTTMSPECARGASADALSNVFSIGCLLHRAVSRSEPFDGDSWTVQLINKMDGKYNRLDESVERFAPGLPQIVATCLNKNPGDRFPSVDALKQALQTIPREVTPLSRQNMLRRI